MGLRTAVTAFLQRRRRGQAAAAAADHAAARDLRAVPAPPTTKDVATGGQTSSTVA